jgi:predicted DNA repair protein MutK
VAGTSLLALLDDIAAILDDVAVMTKIATKKTAGVLGDDLALNAEQVTGVAADRELPVVWAVAKGSAVNKVILVPAALVISAVAPFAITPLLMLGGAFLCYEGFEKVAHKLLQPKAAGEAAQRELRKAAFDPKVDMVAFEKEKIRGAVRTDFILSAEIVVIALGTVAEATFGKQVAVLVAIAVAMTVGVYGLVAGIVKLDDAGLALQRSANEAAKGLGAALLWTAPYLMKGLSLAGTAAMFLVGGGILTHGLHFLEAWGEGVAANAGALGGAVPTLLDAVTGIVTGGVLVALVGGVKRVVGGGAKKA